MRKKAGFAGAAHRSRENGARWALFLALLLIAAFSAHGLAEDYPESEHPYENNSDITWTYTYAKEAYALKITFSGDTELENNFDFLYITGEDGTEQKFTGVSLQGESVYVVGDSFTLRLTSDSSVTKNGFTVTAVEAVTQEEYEQYISTPRYSINASGVIVGYSGMIEDLVVPAEIDGITVTGIGYAAFGGNSYLVSVTLPDSMTSIGNSAFRNCSGLTSVTLPDGLMSLGADAFYNCSSLTGIELPDGITSLGEYTFYKCSSLASIDLPAEMTDIGNYAFYNCSSLTGVDLSAGLKSIGYYAFYGCSGLTGITLPEGLTDIGSSAFMQCSRLTSIYLPDSIESLGTCCFPTNAVLYFGSSEVIETYALEYGLQYVSDSRTVLFDGEANADVKADWIVKTYTDASMSEYERALRLHNWLCTNVQYDYSTYYGEGWSSDYSPYLAEGPLLGGWAVCSGYARAYMMLLEKAGIEARYVTGYNHAWNLVNIDGKWYHTDVTWDDSDYGYDYDYFCLSDMAIQTETNNHSPQYGYSHLICDFWEANYYYRNGYLDAALASLRAAINESIAAGTYSGTITLSYSTAPQGQYSQYTAALILNNAAEWDIAGRAEVTPNSSTSYDFVFYPDEELVSDIVVEGIDTSLNADLYYYMYPGYTAQMNVSTRPQGRDVVYASSDEDVVTVSGDGVVTAVSAGTANISLTSGNCTRAFSIRVTSSLWLDTYSCSLDVGETVSVGLSQAYCWFLTDSAAVWTIDDETIATVSETGEITGIGYGKTTMTCTTAAGAQDTVTVHVRKPVTEIVFDQEVYESYTGLKLMPSVHAVGCDQDDYKESYGNFTYTMSDRTIASYTGYYSPVWMEEGEYWLYRPSITCLAPGEVTLTASARDGSGVTGSCTIIVREAPVLSSVSFESDTWTATAGQKIDLIVRTESDDPDFYKENYGGFDFTSSDDDVATKYYAFSPVWNEELGCWEYTVRVSCLAPGEVTFTATARDGSGLTADCRIVVHSDSPFVLPASTRTIGSEAFLAIAVEEVILPEGIESIGSRAFGDSASLKLINLPASLTSIAEDAFEGSPNVALICAENSAGQSFAENSGLPYIVR